MLNWSRNVLYLLYLQDGRGRPHRVALEAAEESESEANHDCHGRPVGSFLRTCVGWKVSGKPGRSHGSKAGAAA